MKTTAAVIDFGTNKIVTLIAESGAFSRFDIRGTGTVPYAGYEDGRWIEPIELAGQVKQSIAAAEFESKTSIKEIFVSVPADLLQIKLADTEIPVLSEDGRLSEADMDAVQDAAAESLGFGVQSGTIVARSPAWFSVDGRKKNMSPVENDKKGSMIRCLTSFVIAEEGFVSQMREMFGAMQITIRGFVIAALGTAIHSILTDERDRTAVLVDCGYLNTEISVIDGDAFVFHRVLPIGGGFITADLCENLCIDLASAEQLKREFSLDMDELEEEKTYSVTVDGSRYDFKTAYVAGAMTRTMEELLSGIENAMRDAGAFIGSDAKVYLTGGGLALMKGAADLLSDRLGRTVKIIQANSAKIGGPQYASVMGMMDQVFNALEPRDPQRDSLPGRLVSGVKNFLRKEDKLEEEK